ncbi:MAG: helix-turn-helix transcriptional regulator [Candidatus Thorarchaeota archaeon]
MNVNDLLFEFSNKDRYNVLKTLYNESKKHSQLQRELNIPGSEVSRHLKRLNEKNLIIKNTNNKYIITNIGKIFIRMIDIFEVSLSHKTFLNSHDIISIPVHLIFQLGKLKDLDFGDKTMENMEIFENLVKDSSKFLYAITDQYQKSLLKEAEKKMNEQVIDIKALIDKNLVKTYRVPEEWSQLFKEPDIFYEKLKIFENIRLLKEIPFSLVVSDKGAILFLNKEGEIDYSQCLIDNHESFINWTKELFEFYWKKGKPYKRNFL